MKTLFIIFCIFIVGQLKEDVYFLTKSKNDNFVIVNMEPNEPLAKLIFYNGTYEIGAQTFTLIGYETDNIEDMFYNMGFLEGYVNSYKIFLAVEAFTTGNVKNYPGQTYPSFFVDFLTQNKRYMDTNCKSPKNEEWKEICLTYKQQMGVYDGFLKSGYYVTLIDFLMYVSNGDWDDLSTMYDNKMNKEITIEGQMFRTHCTGALRKNSKGDVFVGHVTWDSYVNLHMVSKTYVYKGFNGIKSKRKEVNEKVGESWVSMHSQPGLVGSNDDFYTNSHKLAIFETSYSIYNMSLYDLVTPDSVLCNYRSLTASRVAKSAKEWARLFLFENSGTYNNQYNVFDYKSNEVLGIEQLPGEYSEVWDRTKELNDFGFIPSFNVPYTKNVYEISGTKGKLIEHPDKAIWLSYYKSSRYQISAELLPKVETIYEFQDFLRHNSYKTEKFTEGDPGADISSRYDLRSTNAVAFGSHDAKCVDNSLIQAASFLSWEGPAYTEQCPPYEYDVPCNNKGLPKKWNFQRNFYSARF
eukprot:TRINITY_DN1130_c0_g1_i1.p1 TRINITY_DN1130_c0_g1~~TRINITY_DN1130_c0_g1_i1.p1  ORF type:complete len:533 (+),score=110.57 TRINITY_DN1130_c0_g1_i1:33-1601(+)